MDTGIFGTPDFELPEDLTVIEDDAFVGADMTVVYIPDGCSSIGAGAFRDCTNLSQIRIPDDCTIGTGAFDGCGYVTIFGTGGSPAEDYCDENPDCEFVEE